MRLPLMGVERAHSDTFAFCSSLIYEGNQSQKSPRYHTIETVSVLQTKKYKKRPNQSMSKNLQVSAGCR